MTVRSWEETTCDGCGKTIPADAWEAGWITLSQRTNRCDEQDEYHCCSWSCVLTVATRALERRKQVAA